MSLQSVTSATIPDAGKRLPALHFNFSEYEIQVTLSLIEVCIPRFGERGDNKTSSYSSVLSQPGWFSGCLLDCLDNLKLNHVDDKRE